MRMDELEARLRKRGIGTARYSIGVGRRDSVCIEQVDGEWAVYVHQFNRRNGERRFGDEDAACGYFLDLIDHLSAEVKGDGRSIAYWTEDRVPVEERIRAGGIGTAHYAIGEIRDDAWCLVREHGSWLVFRMENGRRTRAFDHGSDFAAAESTFAVRIGWWGKEQLAKGTTAEALAADVRTAPKSPDPVAGSGGAAEE